MCAADGSAPFCQRVLPLWALCRLASTDPSEDPLMAELRASTLPPTSGIESVPALTVLIVRFMRR